MNVTVTYSAITFCTIRIWKAVRKGVFSARMKVLQGQLNSALAIQVCVCALEYSKTLNN